MPRLPGLEHAKVRAKAIFWDLQSLVWDDYLDIAGFRDEIDQTAAWLDSYVEAGTRVLDLGCGTGNYSLSVARLGHAVTGIDFASGMLRRAAVKARALPDLRVEFCSVDFDLPLPFERGSFGAAVALAVLQCSANPAFLLAQVNRVLCSQGVLLIGVLDPAGRSAAKPQLRMTPLRWLARQAKGLAGRAGSVRRHSREDLWRLTAGAGLQVLEQRQVQGMVLLLCRKQP